MPVSFAWERAHDPFAHNRDLLRFSVKTAATGREPGRALMAGRSRFEDVPLDEVKAPEHDLDYLTNFERKYRIEGRAIYRKHYRLVGSG